ncbi:hypothetical protein [Fundidesulfovibrio terrae]|uniref:hypothetical protein n=1 Tax=Fundidesulfovibrio terrae TaxID=2922866 RepID=UPI001FB02EED|nr:hypothetical protein [Fundidesulfovibrio terrae]
MKYFLLAAVAAMCVLASGVDCRADWTQDRLPPQGVQGLLRDGGEVRGADASGEYQLLDSHFNARVVLEKSPQGGYLASGTLTLADSANMERWSSWRFFIFLFDGQGRVAKVHVRAVENARHELAFSGVQLPDKPFDRFEISIIGIIRYRD